MTRRWESAIDGPSVRDTAMLAEVLRTLRGQLEEGTDPQAVPPEVEDLVSHAVAELQRITGAPPPVGAIAPVLGAGVLQELLRRRREGLAILPARASRVDEKR
ncbi:MAG: hypothetical protein ACT4P7_00870 [Gemmatimonadaceae bacterium]